TPSVKTARDRPLFDHAITASARKQSPHNDGQPTNHKNGEPTKQDLTKARDGQVTYTVRPGDNLTKIASRFGLNLADLEAANPKLSRPPANANLIHGGQKVLVLNKTLSGNAEAMARTKDPATLKRLIAFDLGYTTRGLATPGDQLSAQ